LQFTAVRQQRHTIVPYLFASNQESSRTAEQSTMLSWPYAHLIINHFPVVLSVAALAVTVLASLLNRRGLWLTAMGALAGAGLFVYPVHFTGDKAGRVIRHSWFIQPGVIKAHDDAAAIAMYVILLAGAFAAYSWWRTVKDPVTSIPAWMRAGVALGALAAVVTVTYTAYLGGKIIHDAPILKLQTPPVGLSPGVASPRPDSTSDR
jgi:uncharacterized membrane protein